MFDVVFRLDIPCTDGTMQSPVLEAMVLEPLAYTNSPLHVQNVTRIG